MGPSTSTSTPISKLTMAKERQLALDTKLVRQVVMSHALLSRLHILSYTFYPRVLVMAVDVGAGEPYVPKYVHSLQSLERILSISSPPMGSRLLETVGQAKPM